MLHVFAVRLGQCIIPAISTLRWLIHHTLSSFHREIATGQSATSTRFHTGLLSFIGRVMHFSITVELSALFICFLYVLGTLPLGVHCIVALITVTVVSVAVSFKRVVPVDSLLHVCVNAGVSSATLLHSKSLRGHRDCFEKCHLIANQKLSRSKVSRSAYEGMKLAFSQKLNRIIQYAQNKDSVSSIGPGRRGAKLLCYSQQGDRKLLPQSDAQVPRYTPCWDVGKATGLPDYAMGMLECRTVEELGLLQEAQSDVWSSDGRNGRHSRNQGGGQTQHRHQGGRRDELTKMSVDDLHQLNNQLLMQVQKVFEELTEAVQEKDSLASELHVRHIAIEQLFKNCAKLPWLHISRAGVKDSSSTTGPVE
ncbi:protein EURL homolog isoform X2 [Anarrhichthys ocellatus]|uniref:protein EURL homolog isoform X2 n=1 Tax=Anarrhichthys ocellatus TaxID=433405 RepID=UPI0012EDD512|nr:protein EURL homolog isoform X2 [Anarrhichthys ocellatus]